MTHIPSDNSPEILVIGEVLFDLFPDYRRLGGAPFNFAVHMQRFGFEPLFMSRIGKDDNGREIEESMHQMGLKQDLLQKDSNLPTGFVSVTVDSQGVPKFDIYKNVAYDNLDYTQAIDNVMRQQIRLIYFGTLIQRTPKGFENVQRILNKRHSATLAFCDLNFRKGCYNREVVLASLKQADILKLNQEELKEVGDFLNASDDTETIITHLLKEYQIKAIAVTRGSEGSEWFDADHHYRSSSVKVDRMIDTVGAGDAFAAAAAAGYLKHWPVDQTLNAANQFAAHTCGVKGALPADDRLYENFNNIPLKQG